MKRPNFDLMTNQELIERHLQNYQSEALSVYVRRLNKDPKTVWVKPEESMKELDNLMRSLQSKISINLRVVRSHLLAIVCG